MKGIDRYLSSKSAPSAFFKSCLVFGSERCCMVFERLNTLALARARVCVFEVREHNSRFLRAVVRGSLMFDLREFVGVFDPSSCLSSSLSVGVYAGLLDSLTTARVGVLGSENL